MTVATTHRQTFPFRPKPKQRPRLGKGRRVFTPDETLEFEDLIRTNYDGPVFEGPVSVDVVFDTDCFVVTITEMPESVRPKHVRGDVDNLQKAVLDGLQDKKKKGVVLEVGAFPDDRQVHALSAAMWGLSP